MLAEDKLLLVNEYASRGKRRHLAIARAFFLTRLPSSSSSSLKRKQERWVRLHSGISALNQKYLQKRKKEVRPVSLIKVSPHPVCFSSHRAFFCLWWERRGTLNFHWEPRAPAAIWALFTNLPSTPVPRRRRVNTAPMQIPLSHRVLFIPPHLDCPLQYG